MNGILQHKYRKASDDPAAWDADQCDRQAVTVAFAHEHLCDEPLYLYMEHMSEHGMDPWRLIDGIDKMLGADQSFILDGAAGWSKTVGANFRIFVGRKTLRKLGLLPGEPSGPSVPENGYAATHYIESKCPDYVKAYVKSLEAQTVFQFVIKDGWAVYKTTDDRGGRGGLIGIFDNSKDATDAARGRGWYGGTAVVDRISLLHLNNGVVYPLASAEPVRLNVDLAMEMKNKSNVALNKLTPDERRLLNLPDPTE